MVKNRRPPHVQRMRHGREHGVCFFVIGAAAILFTAACAHDANLNATLWIRSSAEYRAEALQCFRMAEIMLDRGLDDPQWSAALEQTGGLGLPPAVILDVDDTVLDNSPYEAWLIRKKQAYDEPSWSAWCHEAMARPIPGALEFARHAAGMGVTVFYVTNRSHTLEDATRENLAKLGFPLDAEVDAVLMKGEREPWGSKKGGRRALIGQRYRILLLVGDNLGDFVDGYKTTLSERQKLVERHRDKWGTRWIVLPNPMYGSWESALYDFDHGLKPSVIQKRKMESLDEWKPASKFDD